MCHRCPALERDRAPTELEAAAHLLADLDALDSEEDPIDADARPVGQVCHPTDPLDREPE